MEVGFRALDSHPIDQLIWKERSSKMLRVPRLECLALSVDVMLQIPADQIAVDLVLFVVLEQAFPQSQQLLLQELQAGLKEPHRALVLLLHRKLPLA